MKQLLGSIKYTPCIVLNLLVFMETRKYVLEEGLHTTNAIPLTEGIVTLLDGTSKYNEKQINQNEVCLKYMGML